MAKPLFGMEAELGVSATRDGQALPTSAVSAALAQAAQRTLAYLPGGGSRMFLANGALFYVDCGSHPEWSTPECTSPGSAVCHLRAGERMVAGLANLAREALGAQAVFVSRANVDYRSGSTWGCHESYLANGPVAAYKALLIPHLASRIVYTGSGGLDPLSPGIRFSLSPRVAHIDRDASPESTAARGIFHTRDEPLCQGYSRIHVLAGDNACSQRASWLKVGTTALVVALGDDEASRPHELKLADPVGAMKGFARDPRHRTPVQFQRGTSELMSAVQIQRHYLARIERRVGMAGFPDWAGEVCSAWKQALDLVESQGIDDSHAFDWPLKFALFRREIARCGFAEPALAAWSDVLERLWRAAPSDCERTLHLDRARIELLRAKGVLRAAELEQAGRALAAHGLSWEGLDEFNALRRALCAIDVRFGALGEGIFETLDRQGLVPDHRVVTQADIEAAGRHAPAQTRAGLRGHWVGKLAGRRRRYSCDWASIRGPHLWLDLGDPFATRAKWARIFSPAASPRLRPISGAP